MTAACSDDLIPQDEIEYSCVPMGFACEEISTRGSQTTSLATNGAEFVVHARYYNGSSYGRDFFDGQVIKNQAGKWTYSPIKYWPKTGTVDFYAYSPKEIKGTLQSLTMNHVEYPLWLMQYNVKTPQITSKNELDGVTISSEVFARANDADSLQDLILAATPEQDCAQQNSINSKVSFSFKHVLAGLNFQFKDNYSFPTGATHVILAIAPMCTGGTIAFDPSIAGSPIHSDRGEEIKWTIDESEATFYQGYKITEEAGNKKIQTDGKTFFLPPQTLKNFTIIARFYKQSTDGKTYNLIGTKYSNQNNLVLEVGKTKTINLGSQ